MNVAISDVLICSMALLELGSRPINSFDEDTEPARICSNVYQNVRDEMLRQHPWNFAKKRALVSPMKTPPEFDFAYQFQVPPDFIRAIEVNGLRSETGVGLPPGYAFENGMILADVNLIRLRYIFRNDQPQEWDSAFIRLMVAAMKRSIAYAITRDQGAVATATQEWALALRAAKQTNGMELPPQQIDGNAFIEARY